MAGCQNLHYTYDPAGNITHIRDDAQQTDLLPQPARRAERRLHLRRALPADRSDGPRASGAGRRLRRSPHSYNDAPRVGISFASQRRQRDGALPRALRVRRRRQLPIDAASRQRSGTPRLDARVRLRRTEPARSRQAEQPPDEHHHRRNDRDVQHRRRRLRRARQHAAHAAPARSCSGTSRTNCR